MSVDVSPQRRSGCVYEIKLDGYFILADASSHDVGLITRTGMHPVLDDFHPIQSNWRTQLTFFDLPSVLMVNASHARCA